MRLLIVCSLAIFLTACSTQAHNVASNQKNVEISLTKKHNYKNDGREMATATVIYDISPSGFVSNVRILKSEPKGLFDKEIIASVKRWRFDGGKMFTETQKKELFIYYKKD